MATGTVFFGFTGASGGGGGGISGSGASPRVTFWTGSSSVGSNSTFLFNNDSNDEVTMNKLKLASTTLLASPVNGYVEYDGTQLYFTTGGTRYKVSLTT